MDTTNIITGTKAEDRMVLTMTPMEVDAIETALMVARNSLRTANVKAIEDFEHLAPGSEEAHDACNTLMKFLICQSVVEATLDCISDFMEKQKEADMSYYWTCPHCGSNLDPGEICDCQGKEEAAQGAANTQDGKAD